MPMALQTILSWFGGGIAVVIALTGVAYWLFQTFSEKWLETRFSERLEAYRHQLSTLLDRATRLHAQEFEVLPTLWDKLCTSMGSALGAVSPLQFGTDLTFVGDAELEVILEKSPFEVHEKQRVRDAKQSDRGKLFRDLETQHRLQAAYADWRDFNNYAVAKSIFLDPALSGEVRMLTDMIYEALDSYSWARSDTEMNREAREAAKRLRSDGVRLRDEIQAIVSARLRATIAH
jgi:hypothetical protein